jgi:hypothetical protein
VSAISLAQQETEAGRERQTEPQTELATEEVIELAMIAQETLLAEVTREVATGTGTERVTGAETETETETERCREALTVDKTRATAVLSVGGTARDRLVQRDAGESRAMRVRGGRLQYPLQLSNSCVLILAAVHTRHLVGALSGARGLHPEEGAEMALEGRGAEWGAEEEEGRGPVTTPLCPAGTTAAEEAEEGVREATSAVICLLLSETETIEAAVQETEVPAEIGTEAGVETELETGTGEGAGTGVAAESESESKNGGTEADAEEAAGPVHAPIVAHAPTARRGPAVTVARPGPAVTVARPGQGAAGPTPPTRPTRGLDHALALALCRRMARGASGSAHSAEVVFYVIQMLSCDAEYWCCVFCCYGHACSLYYFLVCCDCVWRLANINSSCGCNSM